MKIRTSIFLIIIFIFMDNVLFAYNKNCNIIFNELNKYEFMNILYKEEIKTEINYVTDNSKNQEKKLISRIINRLDLKTEKSDSYDDFQFKVSNSSLNRSKNGHNINVNIDSSKDKTYVDICEYGNMYNDNISKILKNLKSPKINYSKTVRYRIKNENNNKVLDLIKNKLSRISVINYSGGIFGTGYINGEKISFAISDYQSDSYLIVGNPIINMSY